MMNLIRRTLTIAACMPLAAAVIATASGASASAANQVQHAAPAANTNPEIFDEDLYISTSTGPIYAALVSSGPVEMTTNLASSWNWRSGGQTEIQIYDTNDCMQLDHDDSNDVIVASCNDASYQLWNIINDVGAAGYYVFQSQWDTSLCLAYDQDQGNIWAVSCARSDGAYVWYEDWFEG
jgi:hypothetical protein